MKRISIIIFLVLILIPTINSFGVSAPYWQGNPLEMDKGETKIIDLNLQNMMEEKDINVKAEIISGLEIATLKQESFLVKANTADTIAQLEISIPENAKSGKSFPIKVTFKTISDKSQGVALGTGMDISFNVLVKKQEKQFPILIISIILGILILSSLIILIMKKKKN